MSQRHAQPTSAPAMVESVTTAHSTPINSLSPSRAADFLSCPLRYRYRVIDHLPEPVSLAAVRGTVVHAVLEHLFQAPASQRNAQYAYTLLEPAWHQVVRDQPHALALMSDPPPAPAQPPQPLPMQVPAPRNDRYSAPEQPVTTAQEFFDSCQALIDTYFHLEDPTRLEPQQTEMYVSTTLDSGLQLRGIIDRLDVGENQAMRVVDYKTGRAPSEGFESSAMFQMRFYALVLWKLRGVIPTMLQMLYLGNGLVLRYEPDQADLLATQRKLTALWQAIMRAHERQDWRPRTSPLCQSCAFREGLCPAWGGVALPVPAPTPSQGTERVNPAQNFSQDQNTPQAQLLDELD